MGNLACDVRTRLLTMHPEMMTPEACAADHGLGLEKPTNLLLLNENQSLTIVVIACKR